MSVRSDSGKESSDRAPPPAGGEKVVLSPVEEALARQAAMRPPRGQAKRVGPIQVVPKVKAGRKNRRKIPK